MKRKNLIYVGSGGGGGFRDETGLYTHFSTGLLIDYLAREYEKVYWCASSEPVKNSNLAFKLPENVELVAYPRARSTISSLKHLSEYRAAWKQALADPGDVFIRGMLPAAGDLYKEIAAAGCKPIHWLVGNPVALIQSHKRNGFIMDQLALAYARHWESTIKRGIKKTGGAFLCFGQELYERMEGYNRRNIVAAPVLESEITYRYDACEKDTVRVLFVGFIRPEKGVQYLIEALPKLTTKRKVELVCIGTKDEKYAAYNALLDEKIKEFHLEDRVSFPGYMDKAAIYEEMRRSDVFVLPTLSEGAPYVVVEARSQGLPTIASAVGGVPTSIDDGKNGLLVPPKDPDAIADAIDCVVDDEELRRGLVEEGYEKVKAMTFDKFATKIVALFDELNGR